MKTELLTDYELNGRRSLERIKISLQHLDSDFEGVKIVNIDTARIKKYIDNRLEEGASNGTINRELSALKRMLMIGSRGTPPKVAKVPYIPMLRENNIRKGFLEHGDFVALKNALPAHLKDFATFAYKCGWRLSEITNLTWDQVDLNQGIVTLNPGETKNDEGRTLYLDSELRGVFQRQWEARKQAQKILPYVFFSLTKTEQTA